MQKTICITDTQMYSINGGGQVFVRSIINGLQKNYNIIYIGDSDEFLGYGKIKTIKPFKSFVYKLGINKMHILDRGIERLCFRLPALSKLIIKKIELNSDVIISNSTVDYLTLKRNNGIHYKSAIIVKHHPYYKFNQKYPGFIINGHKFFIFVENNEEQKSLSKDYGEGVVVVYPPVNIKEKYDKENVAKGLIEKVAGKKVILSIGRLSENQKRFSVAISAMKELTKSGENFLYLIAGDGPDKERYQKMINSLQLQDKVLLLGFINEDEKSFLLSVSKAVLIVSDRETFGLSMAEALRFGVPVVSTKTSGSLDFIENGKNGFLVDSDAKEISKKISYILKLKNKEYNKMKINSEKSCSKLKPEIATKNIKKRIEELLK